MVYYGYEHVILPGIDAQHCVAGYSDRYHGAQP